MSKYLLAGAVVVVIVVIGVTVFFLTTEQPPAKEEEVIGHLPTLEIGNKWVYNVTSGENTSEWTLSIVAGDRIDGENYYVGEVTIDPPFKGEIGHAKVWLDESTLNIAKMQTWGEYLGYPFLSISDHSWGYSGDNQWPRKVGNEWTATSDSTITTLAAGQQSDKMEEKTHKYRVEGVENVTVPAGTFTTLKIVNRYENNDIREISWYSPEANISIKGVDYEDNQVKELKSYSLKGQAPPPPEPLTVTEITQITSEGHVESDPSWSPDGSKIAYTSVPVDNGDIWIMNSNGSSQTPLTTNPLWDWRSAWTPSDNKIAFNSTRDGTYSIWTIDENGENLQLRIDSGYVTGPCWSPEGSDLAFAKWDSENSNYDLWRTDGDNLVRLTSTLENELLPDWSPDGSKIVYESDKFGNWDIWVLNLDTGATEPLALNFVDEAEPTWSPDGSRIAFSSKESGNSDIWVMNVNGYNRQQLTTYSSFEGSSSWSPDGSRIAFDSKKAGNYDIWVLTFE